MGPGDLLVEGLGQDVDTVGCVNKVSSILTERNRNKREDDSPDGVVVGGPESDLSQDLVGEREGHDEGRVAGSTSQVDAADPNNGQYLF